MGDFALSVVKKIHDYIDERFQDHLKVIQEYLRQPSISSTGEGMKEIVELTQKYIETMLGGITEVVDTQGYPVVHGEVHSKKSKRTLFIYGMYDVQPVEPLNEWISPPFEARIVGEKLIARGAMNSKGPFVGMLNALKSILEVSGDLPFNLVFGVEGEEELGSVHLPEFAEKKSNELKRCEALPFWLPTQVMPGAPPVLNLGFKGIVYMELECQTNPSDIHSGMANIIPNPVWRLLWALNSMRGQDEVLVEGFYDNVHPPSTEDLELTDKSAPMLLAATQSMYNVKNFRSDVKNAKAVARNLIYKPSPINIDGIISGWTGPGTKTITPSRVKAKIDVRIVPNMTTSEVVEKIKQHLKKHGFEDIKVNVLGAYEWVKTSINDPLVQAAIKTVEEFGYKPVINPMMPASAPFYLFCREPFNMRMVNGGLGHGGLVHAPNEYFMVKDIKNFEKSFASLLFNYAK